MVKGGVKLNFACMLLLFTLNMHKSVGRTSSQVRKKAEFRNQYNQVLYLTQDTIWESDTELKLNYD